MDYITSGTCSKALHFDLKDGKVRNLTFDGGCPGNLLGIGKLVEGMDAREVIKRLQGTPCGRNQTSCPDQLARALKLALGEADPVD